MNLTSQIVKYYSQPFVPYTDEAPETPLLTLDCANFSQVGVNDRIKQLIFYKSKVIGIKETGESAPFDMNTSSLPSYSVCDPHNYANNHFFNVSQFGDGGYRIEAKARGVGGGCFFRLFNSEYDFLQAVRNGDMALVRRFLDNHFPITDNVFAYAALSDDIAILKLFVETHHHPDYYIDDVYCSPIFTAVFNGKIENLKYLVSKGYRLGFEDTINTCKKEIPNDFGDQVLSVLLPDRQQRVEQLSHKITLKAMSIVKTQCSLSQSEDHRCENILLSACRKANYIDYLATRNLNSPEQLHSPQVHDEIASRLATEIQLHIKDNDADLQFALDSAMGVIEKDDRQKYPLGALGYTERHTESRIRPNAQALIYSLETVSTNRQMNMV